MSVYLLSSVLGCLWPKVTFADSRSLFDAAWRWTDENAAEVSFSRWRGAPLVVTINYTTCRLRCPMTLDKLGEVERAYARKHQRVNFVLVTLDPSNDTPKRLKAYKKARGLSEATWHLLSGSEAQTKELTRFLGIRTLDDGSHIDHEVKILVFDGDGREVRSFVGLHFDEEAAVVTARSAE